MVSTLTWVLAGILIYTVGAMALRAQGKVPEYIRVQGPLTTVHTQRGRAFLDWLASPRRFWRAWGNFGVGVALVVMVGMLITVFGAAVSSISQPESTPIRDPQNVLVIPGVNDFLPLSAAPEIVCGLLIGLIVHEGGHGLVCRVEDIDIESMGLALFAFIPIGAFVEPSEESRDESNRGAQTRMFAAGVTNNFAITLVAFLLLFGPIAGSIAVVDGVPIGKTFNGSSAAENGMERGDVITAVDGKAVTNESQLEQRLATNPNQSVAVALEGREDPVVFNRSLMITRSIPSLLRDVETEQGNPPRIEAINGTTVSTRNGFLTAIDNRTVVELDTDAGNATLPMGLYIVQLTEDGSLANAGVPQEGDRVITRVDGQHVYNISNFRAALEGKVGEEVEVQVYTDGQPDTYNVTVEEQDGRPILGFAPQELSGLAVDDFGIDPYPSQLFLTVLGGNTGSNEFGFVQKIIFILLLPFLAVIQPTIGYNFAGFVGPVTDFYTVTGPLSALGGLSFTLANLAFWTAWINLQLGMFNLVPAFPLDGGHILRTSTEAVISRLPIDGGRELTTAVTISITLVMLAGLFLMIFGPRLFAG